MDNKALQEFLKTKGLYDGLIDGLLGKKSRDAIDAALAGAVGAKHKNWSDARKLIAVEQLLYNSSGINAGSVDGLIGEQTRYARDVFESRKVGGDAETWRDKPQRELPDTKPSVWPRQADVTKFFGEHGKHQVRIDLPFYFRIAWEPEQSINHTSCHEKVKPYFYKIWAGVLKHYGLSELQRLRLDMFGGCFNDRLMRGSKTQRSMHAWGIAWDVDPDRNQLRWGRELASLDDPPYNKFWEIVEAEGMVSLGRVRDVDWMHFQAARL